MAFGSITIFQRRHRRGAFQRQHLFPQANLFSLNGGFAAALFRQKNRPAILRAMPREPPCTSRRNR
jgi:hypothetical protein